MKPDNCTELCFCSNRNEVGEDEFSKMKLQLEEVVEKPGVLQRKLLELGVIYQVHYFYLRDHPIRTGISFYVLPAETQLNRVLKELESMKKDREIESVLYSLRSFKCTQPSFSVSMRIETLRTRYRFGVDEMRVSPHHKRILSILGSAKQGKLPVLECVELAFDSKTTRLSGGLSLPMKLSLSKDLIERVGEPMITGLTIGFEASPIQIHHADFSLHEDDLVAEIRAYNRFELSEHMAENAYQHALEISKLFLSSGG